MAGKANKPKLRKLDTVKLADIYALPSQANDRDITQVTMGDLHANPMKLLYMLVRHGICEIDSVAYAQLAKIYQEFPQHAYGCIDEKVNQNIRLQREEFQKILQTKVVFKNKSILVRLIGDVLGDRGKNDLLVLDVLELVHKGGLEVRTLLSNHDALFIDAFQNMERHNQFAHQLHLMPGQNNSIDQLTLSLLGNHPAVSWAEVYAIAKRAYFPSLKLIDYSLGDDNHITIFSHAPIDLEVIAIAAKKFGVSWRAETPLMLAKTIDQINQQVLLKMHDDVGFQNNFFERGSQYVLVPKKDVVKYILWNADENLKGFNTAPSNNYTITFVHGHTKGDNVSDPARRVINLDNMLGKCDMNNNEEYEVFVSDEGFVTKQQDVFNFLTQALRNVRESMFIDSVDAQSIAPLLDALDEAIAGFKDLPTFKKHCMDAFKSNEHLLTETHACTNKTYYALVDLFRAFFNLFDLGWVIGAQTMAETYNPLARKVVGRNHFFPSPEAALGKRVAKLSQDFNDALKTLDDLTGKNEPQP